VTCGRDGDLGGAEISEDVSRLVSLRYLNLQGCPLRRLPAALGELDNLSLSAELHKIDNIPSVWLKLGNKGVMTYLHKAQHALTRTLHPHRPPQPRGAILRTSAATQRSDGPRRR
jgi:hypothetical protein